MLHTVVNLYLNIQFIYYYLDVVQHELLRSVVISLLLSGLYASNYSLIFFDATGNLVHGCEATSVIVGLLLGLYCNIFIKRSFN